MQLLDVGSGGGFFPYVARHQGIEARGIEPNRGFAQYALGELGVPTTHAFFQDVEWPAESFDMITLNHVLEHVEDPCQALRRLRRWLKPSGYLVVEVPNIEATYHAPQNRFHLGHLYNFNSATLQRLGEKAQLGVHGSQLVTAERHLHVTFQKMALGLYGQDDFQLPGNYQRIMAILKRHSPWRHYRSRVPYLRLLQKQSQYLAERRGIRGMHSPRAIADSLITSQLNLGSLRVA